MPKPSCKPPESKSFCVMPWFNMATETNGKCKICCVVMTNRYIQKEDGTDFEIQKDDIKEIWNSKYMLDVRQKMLAGEEVADCFYCNSKEKAGTVSPRDEYNERWLDPKILESVENSSRKGGEVELLPMSLEPRPGITCNLKCNMCWSMSSSKIFSERKKWLKEDDTNPVPPFLKDVWQEEVRLAEASDFKWAESEVYLNNLEQCIPDLKRLYFTGGEPVLIPSNIRSLEKLVDLGKTDLLVSFTTNLTRIDDKLLKLLKKFSHVEITGSVDGLGPANDYIRYPSEWSTVSKNLLQLNSYRNIYMSVISVVQMSNILSVLDFYGWVADKTPRRQIQVIPTILQGPDYLRLDVLDDETRSIALQKLDSLLLRKDISQVNRDHLASLGSHLSAVNPRAVELRAKFIEFTQFLDRSRKTNFLQAFPEFSNNREFAQL